MADTNVRVIIDAVDNASGVLKKFGANVSSNFEEAQNASKKFAVGLAGVATAVTGALGFGVKMAADIETAHVGFQTLLGSAEAATEAIEMVKKDAAKTPFELPGLIKANQLLTSVTKDAKRSEALLLDVGKSLTAAGRGGEELDRVIFNLQQISNTGKITEMDIRQFGNAGINILELLADYYGTTKEAASEMVKNSKDAFADLEGAFAKAGGEGGRFGRAFIDQAGTFNQLLSNFKDNIQIAAGEIVKQTGVFDAVKSALGGLVDFIGDNTPRAVETIKELGEFIKQNGVVLAGIILGALAPAFYAWAGGILATVAALAPFVIIGAGIALLVQRLVEHFGGIEEVTSRVGEIWEGTLRPAFEALGDFIAMTFGPILESFKETWERLQPTFQQLGVALQALLPILGAFLGILITIAGALLTGFLSALPAIIEGVVQFVTGLVQIITGALQLIIAMFTGDWSKIKDIVQMMWQGILNLVNGFGNLVLNSVKGFVEGVINFFKNLYHTLVGGSIVPDMVNGILGWFSSLKDKGLEFITNLVSGVASKFSDLAGKALGWGRDIISNFLNGIKNAISGLAGNVKSFVFDKLGIPSELQFQTGGVVPGPIGAPTLATVHGGETITPAGVGANRGGNGGSGIELNVSIGLYAGTETEKRNIAKDLYAALLQVAKAQNKSVAELMGG